MHSLFAFLTGPQLLIVLIVGVLIFGRRLPEIGRYLGKGLVEFKKGLHGLEDEFDITGRNAAPQQHQQPVVQDQIRAPQRVPATAPKFEDTNIPNIPTPPHG
jgi:sec-independent protein translocase protein TatA